MKCTDIFLPVRLSDLERRASEADSLDAFSKFTVCLVIKCM